jgi:hypothetical protein
MLILQIPIEAILGGSALILAEVLLVIWLRSRLRGERGDGSN